MATKVHMEALSPTMEEGQLVRWLKKEGDRITEGDVLAEIETDKATMELVARGAGVLRNVSLGEGETAPVGHVIAVIAGEGEEPGEAEAPRAEQSAAAQGEEQEEAGAGAVEAAEAEQVEEKTTSRRSGEEGPASREAPGRAERARAPREEGAKAAEPGDGRVKASPLARRLASEAGVDLRGVQGSGPGGRITKADIEAAVEAPRVEPPRPSSPAAAEGPEVEEIAVSQMRKTIAKRLVTSIGPVPTFYLTIDVDMTRITEARERVNERLKAESVKASINDFIIKATALALAAHPDVNASWGDTVIRRYRRVHVGVAVAIEDGLITPVVRDADRKRVRDIAVEVKELAGRAREKKLKPDEYTGATFSVSNLGMFGIEEFTAIINPPESGILAIGKVEDRVVVKDGEMRVQPRMRMTMSCDHRVVDGATGARFLQTLQQYLEEPVMMLA